MEVTYGAKLSSMTAVCGDLIFSIREAYEIRVDSNAGDVMFIEDEDETVFFVVSMYSGVDIIMRA